jgi:2-haloacid dehalogenase
MTQTSAPETLEAANQVRSGQKAPSILIFDVNETLISLESMNGLFERVFGDKQILREWFNQMILYAMALTLSGRYRDFWSIGASVFQMIGDVRGVEITPDDTAALRQAMRTMAAHADCEEGLARLKAAGFRMVTLTNSPPTPGQKSPLENAGLDRFFERQFNVQSVTAYKPATAVYRMVAQELGVEPADCCMVACHVWDVLGGQSAGMSGALVTRPGNALWTITDVPQPDAVGATLPALADEMIRLWRS